MMLTCNKQSKFQNYIFLYIFSVQFISRMDGIEFPSWRFSLVLPRYQGRAVDPDPVFEMRSDPSPVFKIW